MDVDVEKVIARLQDMLGQRDVTIAMLTVRVEELEEKLHSLTEAPQLEPQVGDLV